MLLFQLMLSVWWLAKAQHAHSFTSSDGIVKHDTLCFIHNLWLPHHLLLIFLLSEAMTSFDICYWEWREPRAASEYDNSHESSLTELPLNMTHFYFSENIKKKNTFFFERGFSMFVKFDLFLSSWVCFIHKWYTQQTSSTTEMDFNMQYKHMLGVPFPPFIRVGC